MNKINIGELVHKGWDFLVKNPVVFIPIGINTVIATLQVLYLPILPMFCFSFLLNFFLFFLTTQYVYEALRGNPSWKGAFDLMLPKWPALALVVFIYTALVILGMCFLIIPGVFLLVRLGCCDYLLMFDDKEVIESIKESWRLTGGSFWRILATLFILYVPAMIAEALPQTNVYFIPKFCLMGFSQAWWAVTMVLVYLKLKEIKAA